MPSPLVYLLKQMRHFICVGDVATKCEGLFALPGDSCSYLLSASSLVAIRERNIIPMFSQGNGRFSSDATRTTGHKGYESFLHLCTFYRVITRQCIQRACCHPR